MFLKDIYPPQQEEAGAAVAYMTFSLPPFTDVPFALNPVRQRRWLRSDWATRSIVQEFPSSTL